MFQQIIQDILAVAEAGPRAEDVLESLGARIRAAERFECAEIVARTEQGLSIFVIAPGLGDLGARALQAIEALGDEKTLRIDHAPELRDRGLAAPGLTSLLILRLDAPGSTSAAIVLGHSRAWSFAAAPLWGLRTLTSVALRLILRSPLPPPVRSPGPAPDPELARLRGQVEILEEEIVKLRSERASKRRSGKPQ